MQNTPTIAITMGDPAGIGPEIAVKAFFPGALPSPCRIIVIGDMSILHEAAQRFAPEKKLHNLSSLADFRENRINVLDLQQISMSDFTPGTINALCGKASYTYILKAIDLANQGTIDAIVTNPINKTAFKQAGINFPGHTGILAHETGTTNFSMMFMLDDVWVTHVTTHCPIREALDLITHERVYRNITLLHTTLQSLGIEKPVIAVGGLNPHAGEGGLFGKEELLHINPAIAEAIQNGMNVTGPLPPDTVFMRAFKGEFNGIVSMLHDHGFVALKSRDFERCVNITVGLPLIRTSVGHGTAFDIAWKGIASEKSLLEAIKVAYTMSILKKI